MTTLRYEFFCSRYGNVLVMERQERGMYSGEGHTDAEGLLKMQESEQGGVGRGAHILRFFAISIRTLAVLLAQGLSLFL
jgi:hypothetical protein